MATGKRIRGITIEIDGETKGLDKALQDVNKRSNSLKSELKDVDRLLKFDPGNVVALAQKQKLLNEQVKTTGERLDYLKKAEKEVQQQSKKGKISEQQYRNFRREIEFTEGSLRNLRGQLSKVEQTGESTSRNLRKSFGKVKDAAKETARDVGKSLGAIGTAGAAATGALVTGMQEYNQDLARLKTNASIAGRDLELVENAFIRITEVTGEADSAVETVSNLLASGFEDNQLAGAIDLINGAAIRFSDTLKTEGIADGLQETFATGEAIGPFAELLERSGVDLEKFNEALQMAKIVGNETNYVMRVMAEQGFAEVYDKYKELNPEVQANAEAQAKFQKSLSDLSIVLTPLVISVTEMITKITNWANENPKLVETLVMISGAIAGMAAAGLALAPVITAITSLAGLLGIGLLATSGIVLGVIATIGGLIAIGIILWKNWDKIKAVGEATWNTLSRIVANAIGNMIKKAVELKDKFFENIQKIKSFFEGLKGKLKIEIPRPKLPKFSISGRFDLIPPDISVPKLSVDWFKDGGVFPANSPRLIGIGDANVPEAALPLSDEVLGKIAGMISKHMDGGGAGVVIQNMTVRDEMDIHKIARELHNLMQGSRRKL